MTNKELQEALAKLPPDIPVKVFDYMERAPQIHHIRDITIITFDVTTNPRAPCWWNFARVTNEDTRAKAITIYLD
jgi:hypothetical protein